MGIISTCKGSRSVTLPPCLAEWIERNIPNLNGGTASLTINCCESLWVGFLFIKFQQGGFTSGPNTINVTGCKEPIDPCDFDFVETVLHEIMHVLQWRRHPNTFPLRYVWRLIRSGGQAGSGSGHRDEEHAYQRARELREKYERDDPCNCRPEMTEAPESSDDFEEGPRDEIPEGHPEVLDENTVEECCTSDQNRSQTPDLLRNLRRALGEVRGKIAAAHPCGIRFLRIFYTIEDIATGNEINRFEIRVPSYCATFVVHEIRVLLQRGQRLVIKPTAMSCCYTEEYESDYNTSRDIIIFEYQ